MIGMILTTNSTMTTPNSASGNSPRIPSMMPTIPVMKLAYVIPFFVPSTSLLRKKMMSQTNTSNPVASNGMPLIVLMVLIHWRLVITLDE
jgi:hypothetical protein